MHVFYYFREIPNVNLTFAVCCKRHSKSPQWHSVVPLRQNYTLGR